MIFLFIYLKQNIKLKDCKYIISKKATDGGEYFEILFNSVPKKRCIERAVKRCSRQPLPIAADGLRLSKQLEKRLLSEKQYDKILLVNAFCSAIKGEKRALVYDKDGELCKLLLPVLARVGTLCVITERRDIYEAFSRTFLCTVGSNPVLIGRGDAYGFPATLCTDMCDFANGIVFGKGGFIPCGSTVLYRNEQFDRTLMSALYSLYDSKKASLCIPKYVIKKNEQIECEKLKQMLDSIQGLTL